jgi:MFS family permease
LLLTVLRCAANKLKASIITNDLIKIEHRGAYQAYINIFYGLGSSCGAAFGGFLCDSLGWRWAFGIQVPPIALILLLALLTVPAGLGPNLAKSSDQKWYQTLRDFDITGSLCLTLTTGCLILGLNLGGNILPWKHPLIIASLVLSIAAGTALVSVERKAKRPVMPLALLASIPKANLLFSNFFSQIGVLAIIFNAPLYFQAVKLDTPSVSGFRLAAPSFILTVCAVSTGFFINYSGRLKAPQVLGGILMLVGGICLASLWDGIPTWLATIFLIPPSTGQVS